jgi:hypothetical protein
MSSEKESCNVCHKYIDNVKLVCCYCFNNYHPACKKIVGAHIKKYTSGSNKYFCSELCDANYEKITLTTSDPSFLDVAASTSTAGNLNFSSAFEELKAFMISKFDSMEKLLEKSVAENKILSKEVEHLTVKCDYLEACVAEMKYDVDRPNRQSIINNVAVFGIPESYLAEPATIVAKIAAKISFHLNDDNVQGTRSIKNRKKNISTLIIEFKNQKFKQEFLDQRKKYGPILLKDVCEGVLNAEKKIYMRDELTRYGMALYGELLAVRKFMPIKFVWTKHADVFAKATETANFFMIKSSLDIKNFIDLHKPDGNH